MWKTSCGGVSTIIAIGLIVTYLGISLKAVIEGSKDNVEILEEPLQPDQLGSLTFEDMRVMPVVHFGYLASSVYLNPQHQAF